MLGASIGCLVLGCLVLLFLLNALLVLRPGGAWLAFLGGKGVGLALNRMEANWN